MNKPREHCGVMAVRGPDSVVVALEGIRNQQHRGQEAVGMSILRDGRFETFKGLGRVDDVFRNDGDEVYFRCSDGSGVRIGPAQAAIAHVRYSTVGSKSDASAAHPHTHGNIALAWNGTIPNYMSLMNGSECITASDTEVVVKFVSSQISRGAGIGEALSALMDIADGGYAIAAMLTDGTMAAARDRLGVRPLITGTVYGSMGSNLVFASESVAITDHPRSASSTIKSGYIGSDIKPGEILVVSTDACTSIDRQEGRANCVFEIIYFASKESVMDGVSVSAARVEQGRMLARYHGVDADIVVPVPDSAEPMAHGYSMESAIPIARGLVLQAEDFRSRTRSFMQPDPLSRKKAVREKMRADPEVIGGKRLVVIDDSIVRGTTQAEVVGMLLEAGASEVHIRIASPQVKYPCFGGVDFPTRTELIANRMDPDTLAQHLGASSLAYLTIGELLAVTGAGKCHACFSGEYQLRNMPKDGFWESVTMGKKGNATGLKAASAL